MSSNSTFKITSGGTRAEEKNYIKNPNIESTSQGFISSGGWYSSNSEQKYVYSGRFSMRVLGISGDGVRTTASYAETADVYTLSWKGKWADGDDPVTGALAVRQEATYLTPLNYAPIGDDGWYQYWVSFTGTVATPSKFYWELTDGTVVYMDEFRLALGTSIDYFDGDDSDAYWDGTPRNSSSTRPAKTGVEFEFANIDNRHSGFFLDGITPNIAAYRGGGVYNQSVFGDGRTLVDTQYDNVIETIGLKLVASSQDELAKKMQDLRRLLIKAKDFWVNRFATEPVWIEARSSNETNIRYAVIHNAQILSDSDMWRQPFLQPGNEAFLDNISLVIERGHWQDARPGIRSDVDASNQIVYDTNGLTYGMEANREAFILNGRQQANISHIFKWDQGATTWSSNMVDAALPWDWFDLPCQTGDAIYFGIETSDTDAAHFTNLVFDLGKPTRLNDSGSEWEIYYSGSWQTLTALGLDYHDGTAEAIGQKELRRVGPAMLSWEEANSLWSTVAVNGVTGYWIRYYLTTALPATESPTQQNRIPYVATRPYVEIDADEIGGDIDAPVKIIVRPEYAPIGRVLCCARSVSRGSNFTPVINLAQTNNPDGITVSCPGALTTFDAWSTIGATDEGAHYELNVGAQSPRLEQVKVSIASPLAKEYSGRFRLILRFAGYAYFGGGYVDCDFTIDAEVSSGSGSVATSQPARFDYVNSGLQFTQFASDLGVYDTSQFSEANQIDISIYVQSDGTGYLDLYMYDMWLMPVDEFVVDARDLAEGTVTDSQVPLRGELVIDGTQLKRGIVGYSAEETSSLVRAIYNTSSSRRPFVKPNNNVRLYFLNFWMGNYNLFESNYLYTTSVSISKVQQYLSMRGSR